MKNMMDTLRPITGHFRERVLLLAALQSSDAMVDNPGERVVHLALVTTANMAKREKRTTDVSRGSSQRVSDNK